MVVVGRRLGVLVGFLCLFLDRQPGRLADHDRVVAVDLGGDALGQHEVADPDGVADDQVGDVDLDGGGDVGRLGVDRELEHLLLDHAVGVLDVQGLAHQVDGHLDADDLVAADDHEVDVATPTA